MSDITDSQRSKMRHAVGLTAQKSAYRNYCAAGPGDVSDWDALVKAGMAVTTTKRFIPFPLYHVTQEGFDLICEDGEKSDGETFFPDPRT